MIELLTLVLLLSVQCVCARLPELLRLYGKLIAGNSPAAESDTGYAMVLAKTQDFQGRATPVF